MKSPARRPSARDLALAATSCGLDLLVFSDVLATGFEVGGPGVPGLLVVAVAVIGFTPLVLRRRHPLPVFVHVALFTALGSTWFPMYRPTLALLVALYAVVTYERRESPRALAAAASGALVTVLAAEEARSAAAGEQISAFLGSAILYFLMVIGTWTLGQRVRAGQSRFLALQERQEAEAREAVLHERRRIARELHDIVSQSVSVMTLQAAGARRIAPTNPDRATDTLAMIEEVGVQAMGELRRLLGVLSSPEEDSAPGAHASVSPRLDDIPVLLARYRAAGLGVVLHRVGKPNALDPSVTLTSYRVVQEALTNAAKHGGSSSRVSLRLRWRPDALRITVRSRPGRGPGVGLPLSTGHGLLGLQERVRLAGGTLLAQPLPHGEFLVVATLPTANPLGVDHGVVGPASPRSSGSLAAGLKRLPAPR